jgi:DNA-binding XRE family transcriptional regulator
MLNVVSNINHLAKNGCACQENSSTYLFSCDRGAMHGRPSTVPKSENMLIARTIREYRARHGMTLIGMQIDLGISYAQISALESGAALPSLPTLRRIAEFFGFSPRQLGDYVLSVEGARPGRQTTEAKHERRKSAA